MNSLSLIGKTPLVALPGLFPDHRVFGKLEATNVGGSVKDRIALFMINAAEAAGILTPGMTVVEATSGNTGIGLAVTAAVKGYRLKLAMPEDMNEERRSLFNWYGAELVLTPAREGMGGALWAAEQLADQPGHWWARQFDNPANPQAHYETTGPEIWTQTKGHIDHLVVGVGTGGTLTGAGRYLKEQNSSLHITAVEPARSPVLSGGRPGLTAIYGLGAGFTPGVLDRRLIDRLAPITDDDAYDWAKRAARAEGLLLGPSAGAALAAVDALLPSLKAGDVTVAILPDTGDRYTSLMPKYT